MTATLTAAEIVRYLQAHPDEAWAVAGQLRIAGPWTGNVRPLGGLSLFNGAEIKPAGLSGWQWAVWVDTRTGHPTTGWAETAGKAKRDADAALLAAGYALCGGAFVVQP